MPEVDPQEDSHGNLLSKRKQSRNHNLELINNIKTPNLSPKKNINENNTDMIST